MAITALLAPLVAFITVVLVVMGLYALLTQERAAVRQRLSRYGVGQSGATVTSAGTTPLLRDRKMSTIGAFDQALQRSTYAERVALDLARAAVPLRVGEYLLLRWLLVLVLFLVPFAFRMPWYIDFIFAAIGFYLPKGWVSSREKARVRKIEDQLVDALTMMANSLRAGSSFLQAMEMVSKELPPPISQEFGQVLAEVSVGAPVDESLADMSRRVRSYDVYLITTAMIIQRQVGGNLSEVLNNIAHTIRERQRLLRQVQVETAEQRFSAYILLALPVFMLFVISILNRPYIDTLLEPGVGRILLGVALVLQIFGYFVMRRIADVKV